MKSKCVFEDVVLFVDMNAFCAGGWSPGDIFLKKFGTSNLFISYRICDSEKNGSNAQYSWKLEETQLEQTESNVLKIWWKHNDEGTLKRVLDDGAK